MQLKRISGTVALIAIAACMQGTLFDSTSTPEPTEPTTDVTRPMERLAVGSVNGQTVERVNEIIDGLTWIIYRFEASDDETFPTMASAIRGTLLLDEETGCAYLRQGSDIRPAVWPAGTAILPDRGGIRTGTGQVIGTRDILEATGGAPTSPIGRQPARSAEMGSPLA